MDSHDAPPTSTDDRRDELLAFLLANPTMTLQQVSLFDPSLLRTMQIADLVPSDVRRSKSEQLRREEFDRSVLVVLVEAATWVAFRDCYARVGGSRAKLNRSLQRLLDRGAIERRGINARTQYRAAPQPKS